MSYAAALAVWSGRTPRFDVHRIEHDLVLGRDLVDATDDRSSRRHTRVTVGDDGFRVEDLGSRNGTFVDNHQLREPARMQAPFLVRTGRTVFAIVDDFRPYTNPPVEPGAPEALDPIIASEDCVVLLGPRKVPKNIALAIAAARGGDTVAFDARGMTPLEAALGTGRPRTVILEHPEGLCDADLATLALWLETDLCVATCARGLRDLRRLPPAIVQRLTLREIAVPEVRFDAIARATHELIGKHAPGATAHATMVEAALLVAFDTDEETVRGWLEDRIRGFALLVDEPVMRSQHLGVPPSFPADRVIWPGMRITWRRRR